MAATSTQEESLTSFSALPQRYFQIFLSFRGKDTRKNFTDHLYHALIRHGFSTFRDNNELEIGEEIGPELLKSIEGSRISVIVFSKNYAQSRWCLEELAKIMECKETFQQMVVPVFYDVDPYEVRARKGSFGEAFAKLEERYSGRGMEGQLESWKAALEKAGNLSGHTLRNVADGYESQFIMEIVRDISEKLNLPYFDVAKYPVGVHPRVQQVNALLSLGSDDVRIIVIFGIDGLGKTTIAKAVYNQIRHKFDSSSFLAGVKANSERENLVGLQEQLFFHITGTRNQTIINVDHGIALIKDRLWHRRVLIVLDDVDTLNQVDKLAINRDWLHSGSRIIITTTDKSSLKSLGVDAEYMPELLTKEESLQLFGWHAFKNKHPGEEYVELSRKLVSYAGGIPLALETLGSSLNDQNIDFWRGRVESLKDGPPNDLQSKLRLSYESLTDNEKDLFLDIACFFINMDHKYVIKILEGCVHYSKVGLEVLVRRCLIRYEFGLFRMHGLLCHMGRKIVLEENRKEPGKRSRLWSNEASLDVLISGTGSEVVEGLILNLSKSEDEPVMLKTQAFEKMKILRLLVLNHVHVSGSFEYFSKRLQLLCWFGFPFKSIPPKFCMRKLVVLDMRYSKLKQVWKGEEILSNLKILNLSHSYCLTETPDFSKVPNLEMLSLNNCTNLVKVHQSIECLSKLVGLDLKECKNLMELPPGIGNLTSLQYLSLSGCLKFEKLLGCKVFSSSSWLSLFSSLASPIRSPDSISLSPAAIPGFVYITLLNLENINWSYVPDDIFCTLPASISHIAQLRLSHLARLQSFPEHPVDSESTSSDFQKSLSLPVSGCCKLVENDIIASDYRKNLLLQNKGLSVVGGLKIAYAGGEVPDLFIYQSARSFLSFAVPLLPDQKIRGWILCVVLAGCIDELVAEEVDNFNDPLVYIVKNKTKGFEKRYCAAFNDIPKSLLDHMWLHSTHHHYCEFQMEAGDKVEYSVIVTEHTAFQVKKLAIKLIYEGDENDYVSSDQAMTQYVPHSNQGVILDKNVSADLAVADNKIQEERGVNLIYENDVNDYLSCDPAMTQYASLCSWNLNCDKNVSAGHAVSKSYTRLLLCISFCVVCLSVIFYGI